MGLDEFEGDGVLLLISSGKHFPYYAYYAEARTGVQTIWVPITNDVDEDIQIPYSSRGYYRVLDLQSGIAPAFLRFLQDKCFPTFQVGGDPIVISLDKRGRLVHSNALHMIFTWGIQLSERKTMRSGDIIPSLENELRERTSGADRVIDDIDKQIHNFAREVDEKINDWVGDIKAKMKSSIDDDEYIFLCGGNNIKRVLEFVQEVRSEFPMNMKIAYVGRRRKMIEELDEACDYVFELIDDINCFWARLYSVTSSRIQYLNKVGLDEGSDEILQGLRKLLSYEDECTTIESWALLGKGKRIIACDVGDKMLGALNEYEKWKNNAHANDFEQAFKDCYEMLNTSSSSSHQHSCCALNYSSNLDQVPEVESCPQTLRAPVRISASTALAIGVAFDGVIAERRSYLKACMCYQDGLNPKFEEKSTHDEEEMRRCLGVGEDCCHANNCTPARLYWVYAVRVISAIGCVSDVEEYDGELDEALVVGTQPLQAMLMDLDPLCSRTEKDIATRHLKAVFMKVMWDNMSVAPFSRSQEPRLLVEDKSLSNWKVTGEQMNEYDEASVITHTAFTHSGQWINTCI
nr:protein SIEVE ELEMENT OCCLUSION B-like [Ipomoea batatas]